MVHRPSFTGRRVIEDISLEEIAGFINETALFRNQWQFRPEAKADGTTKTDDFTILVSDYGANGHGEFNLDLIGQEAA